MFHTRSLIAILLIFLSTFCFAETNENLFKQGSIAILAPPVINKKYVSFEYGFIIEKKIKDYHYNAYVTGALFEDWLDKPDKIRAGGLGFKAGALFPVVTSIPVFIKAAAGFAKTTMQKDPIVGRDEQSMGKRSMFLLETGLVYHIDRYAINFTYQRSNIKYFTRHMFFSFGVNY